MHTKQYSRQQEKRNGIVNQTLVIGIDIGSEFNAGCFMDKEGNVLGCYPTIYNSRKGFEHFQTMVMRAKTKHKLTDVLIGMEPTGHYWRKIAFFASPSFHEGKGSVWVRTGEIASMTTATITNVTGKNYFPSFFERVYLCYDR